MQILKKILKALFFAILIIVVGVSLYVFRPWADHQGWRLFHKNNPFITRVHTQSNWDLVSPYVVLKASDSPRQYQRKLTKLSDITYEYDGATYTAEDYFRKANLVGLMVLYDNKIVVENYDQGVDADTTYMIMSSTKSFTSTMVGIAVKDGVIENLDDRVEKYAPQYKGTAYGETPIKHVLMMSSGIDFSHINAYAPNGRVRLYFDLWVRRMSFDKKTAALTRRVESGTEFVYLATDTHVLSRVVEGAYGRPYIDVVQEKLWSPGGFSSDAQWSVDGDGNPFGQMALSVTLQDFAHFGQLQLEDLVLDGRKVVKDDWLDMVQNAQAPFQEPQIMEDGSYRDGYSLQWWLPVGYDQEFIARGAGDQYMYVNKKDNYVVAQFSAEAPVSRKEEIAFYRAVGKYFSGLH
jgi:CubicO group peptidase (beta-lactamase class C family)